MKKLLVFMLLLSAGAFAQVKPFLQDSQTISVSGNSININNPWAYITGGFYEVISGAPASVTITIKGCFRGDTTCTDGDTLDTYTTVANSIRKPSATIGYDFFQVTASWTGGTNPTVQIKTTLSAAKKGGGAAAVGTASQIQATDGAGNLVASSVTADSSGNLNAAAGTQYFHNPFNGDGTPNAAAGTSNGLLAKLVNTGGVVQIQTLGTSDTTSYPLLVTAQRVGTTFNGCTSACTTGFAYVAAVGTVAACTFDNTAVVGDFVIDGTTGQCHDTGSATAPTSGTFVGRARTAGTGSQSVSIEPQVAGGAGGAVTSTSFSLPGNTALLAIPANNTRLWGFIPTFTINGATQLCWNINTADNTANLYDVGIYDSSANLVAHIGATAGTTFAPATGLKCAATLASYSVTGGAKYYFAMTGNAATAILAGTAGAGTEPNFASSVVPTGGGTSGGVLNASGVITIPADNFTLTSPQSANLGIH